MRLSKNDLQIIKLVILKYISDAKIILFGSRVHDHKKGGDIDLLVQTQHDLSLQTQLTILSEIEYCGLSRKIDLLVETPLNKSTNIITTAIKEGIVL
ncbi:MAG: nucleotidyltransferase domain-containing protein [Helicobacteraceae bacterium]|nr:nucleotidyltransferase domain-containing protein [Helicobacteraceae bacterium]